jgi:hypothetical protein
LPLLLLLPLRLLLSPMLPRVLVALSCSLQPEIIYKNK